MKGGAWLALYAGGAFTLGGALAGPLYAVLGAFAIAPVAFPEFTLRLVQLFALLGLWPLLRVLNLRGAKAWGLAPGAGPGSFVAGALGGFVAGASMMAALVAVLVALGARGVAGPGEGLEWPVRLMRYLAAAVAVALVEELWFRGALHSAFQRTGGAAAALFAVAALYSGVHFLDPGAASTPEDLGIGSGFAVLGGAFHLFTDPGIAGPAAALFAAGVLLGVVRHRTGRVTGCIGIHAGWVLVDKAGRTFTLPEPESRWAWVATGYDGVVGWGACVMFSVLALLVWRFLAPSRRPP